MKIKSVFMFLIVSGVVATLNAAPIVNENLAASGLATVYGDSHDPKLFYYAPNHMGVCKDENGAPIFAFKTYKNSNGSRRGLVMSTLCLRYSQGIQTVLDEIRSRIPDARFAGVAFSSSRVILKDEVLRTFIEVNSCDHVAGIIGQEQACSFVFNSRGRQIFIELMKTGLGLVLQFEYVVHGVRRNAAGQFEDTTSTVWLAGRMMAEDAIHSPELKP